MSREASEAYVEPRIDSSAACSSQMSVSWQFMTKVTGADSTQEVVTHAMAHVRYVMDHCHRMVSLLTYSQQPSRQCTRHQSQPGSQGWPRQ